MKSYRRACVQTSHQQDSCSRQGRPCQR